jgi:hypothetical protein
MPSHNTQEAVMGRAIPTQHPAVVLRSHFNLVRALLAVAMIAVVALTATIVILANDENEIGSASSAGSTQQAGPRAYGSFNPSTGGPRSAELPQRKLDGATDTTPRYDGGPEEGTRGLGH